MTLVEQDTAYFLHQIPYRDNSAIVHLFTRKHGKVSFMVNGIKAKKNTKRPFLQPCRALSIDYQLKKNLSKLISIDFTTTNLQAPAIEQFMLYQYANELLLTILPSQLPVTTLFDGYTHFLALLAESRPHAALRHIELAFIILFQGLPTITQIAESNQEINVNKNYWFDAELGLFTQKQQQSQNGIFIEGAQVQAFNYVTETYLRDNDSSETLAQGAKKLSSFLILQLLNGKQLKSRLIYQALQEYI